MFFSKKRQQERKTKKSFTDEKLVRVREQEVVEHSFSTKAEQKEKNSEVTRRVLLSKGDLN